MGLGDWGAHTEVDEFLADLHLDYEAFLWTPRYQTVVGIDQRLLVEVSNAVTHLLHQIRIKCAEDAAISHALVIQILRGRLQANLGGGFVFVIRAVRLFVHKLAPKWHS